jgi:hypothetical protein
MMGCRLGSGIKYMCWLDDIEWPRFPKDLEPNDWLDGYNKASKFYQEQMFENGELYVDEEGNIVFRVP